jgi:pyruvate/2-oxoglutarate dehydrogenase complex dihydrolipoamide dehydrogenase (E3) component
MTNDLKTYDLVVMGGGPAGAIAAAEASSFRKSVALVDKHRQIGGAGINTGTVPSKTLRETALALSGLKSRNLYGVDLSLRREVTVADFLGHEEHVKDAFRAGITQRLQVLQATIYYGTCTFLDAHTIQVNLGSEPAHYSPHSFRATGITNFLENDGTLEAAQRIAGHADSRTTKLYDRGQKVLLEDMERIRY